MKRKRIVPGMLEECDFSKSIERKYAKKYSKASNVVVIDPNIRIYFPNHESVNQASRSIIEINKNQ